MTEKVGTITATTRTPRLWDENGEAKDVRLIAWSNGMVTWETVDE